MWLDDDNDDDLNIDVSITNNLLWECIANSFTRGNWLNHNKNAFSWHEDFDAGDEVTVVHSDSDVRATLNEAFKDLSMALLDDPGFGFTKTVSSTLHF